MRLLAAVCILLALGCEQRGSVKAEQPTREWVAAVRVEGEWFGVWDTGRCPDPEELVYSQLSFSGAIPVLLRTTDVELPAEDPLASANISFILETVLGREGRIRCARFVKAPGGYEAYRQAVTAALRKWDFEPATLGGESVPVYFNVSLAHVAREGDS